MIITFEIEGKPQQIKWDNYCFHACHPNNFNSSLGYYKNIGGAVSKLIKHHYFSENDIVDGFETQVELRDFAEQFDILVKKVSGIDDTKSLNPDVFTVTEREKTVKVVSEETKAKMRAARQARKERQHNISEEDDYDVF